MARRRKGAGFREAKQKAYRAGGKRGRAKTGSRSGLAAAPEEPSGTTDHVRLRLGPGGRFVIPKMLRKAMEVKVGDVITAKVVDGELRVLGSTAAVRKVQKMFSPYKRPGVSEVDEFLAERRRMWEEENPRG